MTEYRPDTEAAIPTRRSGTVVDPERWSTLPGWTRAHALEQFGSLGAIRLWVTACGRDYQTSDPEFDDEPIAASDSLPRCIPCRRERTDVSGDNG